MSTYTERELRKVWTLPEAQQQRLLRPALARLYEDPDISEAYLTDWTSTLRDSAQITLYPNISFEPRTTPRGGHERFIYACMNAGLSIAMLKVSELPNPAAKYARIHALSTWASITKLAASTPENSAILNSQKPSINAILLRSLKSDLFMERARAAVCIREYTWGPWTRQLSNEDIADIMFECLLYASAGYQSIFDELDTPSHAWQKDLMRGFDPDSTPINIEEAKTLARRFWSQNRDDALKAALGLLFGRERFTTRRDCLEIITLKPQILSQLLIILSCDRTPWHPEAVADAFASRLLTHLLMAPLSWIPELSELTFSPGWKHFPPGYQSKTTAEWFATVACWELFVERPRWRELLLEKWKKLQAENKEDILRMFQQTTKYGAWTTPGVEDLNEAITHRGICRISILRILINLTYGETSINPVLPTSVLLSLLPVAYEASQKVPSDARVARSKRHTNGALGREALLQKERKTEVFHAPSRTFFGRKCLACVILPPEYILGPVLLFRILHRIYESFNTNVTSWVSLPEKSPPDTYLGQVQQIASPKILGMVMRNVALKRIPAAKDEGAHRMRQNFEDEDSKLKHDFARAAYLGAAELAVVADRFHANAGPEKQEWEELVPLIHKDMVACLGNVSEMSRFVGEWDLQWWYGTHAIASLDGVDENAAKSVGWDPVAMRGKNARRVAAAKDSILAHSHRP